MYPVFWMFITINFDLINKYNFTAFCELIVWMMWDPQHLTPLQAFTAFYGDSFILLFT